VREHTRSDITKLSRVSSTDTRLIHTHAHTHTLTTYEKRDEREFKKGVRGGGGWKARGGWWIFKIKLEERVEGLIYKTVRAASMR
jgi:hypothetical protein